MTGRYRVLFRLPFLAYFLLWDRDCRLFCFGVKYYKDSVYRYKVIGREDNFVGDK